MGQRTQQFFRIPNPVPAYRKSLDFKDVSKEEVAEIFPLMGLVPKKKQTKLEAA